MNLYADYNFYVSEYKGQATEEEFQRQIVKASAHVRRITFGRADNCMEMEEVKLAACAVCDMLNSEYGNQKEYNGRQIISENTDGYSVSYMQESVSGETLEELVNRKVYETAKLYLEPTVLLSWEVYG